MKKAIILTLLVSALMSRAENRYEANWQSLDARPVPQWWTDAKFGIFVHWGPYAVPAYAPTGPGQFGVGYSEWYLGRLLTGYKVFQDHHAKHYANAPYENFAARFTAENFDPREWAELFKKAGAKYAVLTSKHHDGYALWPSPESAYYNSTVLGSGRDLCGEFTAAMKEAGLKSGFYYSLLEYANPLYPRNFIRNSKIRPYPIREWAARMNLPQMKELVENYRPDIVWPDGEWDFSDKDHLSEEFLAWLYNESSVKDSVVVNDRWGAGVRGKHGGHYTTEYVLDGGSKVGLSEMHPWEECRGIGRSFGYNRFETAEDYMTREQCLETLVKIVSAGGNLLLNVGPTADGRIPAIMQDRLLAMGRWLETNGEAIYGSTRYCGAAEACDLPRVYFTAKGTVVYAIVFGAQAGELHFRNLEKTVAVSQLGKTGSLTWRVMEDGAIAVQLTEAVPTESAVVIKFEVGS